MGTSIGIKSMSTVNPNMYKLEQNYPNPFNPVTKIKFQIPSDVKRERSDIKLVIYDMLGKEVTTLVNEQLQPGTYEVTFDAHQPGLGSNLSSGIYFYRLTVSDPESSSGQVFSETKKLMLIK
jgi:hypothetical protein